MITSRRLSTAILYSVFCLLSPALSTAQTCTLTIRLIDAATGEALPGLIRARDTDGKILELPGALHRITGLTSRYRAVGWHALTTKATITLPQAPLTFEALHGLETEIATATLDLTGKTKTTLTIPLTRIFDTKELGLAAGNTHVHLKDMTREEADAYLRTIPRADGLDLVFLSYLERAIVDRTYTSNRYTSADLKALSSREFFVANGEEHRHNFGGGGQGYGHVMFLDLIDLVKPVSIGPGITKDGADAPSLRTGIEKARAQGATVVWCHNGFGLEDIPNWLGERVDAQNIFDGGNHGGYEDTYYRYLNIGLQVPFSTGTDWFIYDFSRVYIPYFEKTSVDAWLADLSNGRGTITNGPLLELEVEREAPGGVINIPSPSNVAVTARAIGRSDFSQLQLIQNGEVIRSSPSKAKAGHFESELTFDLEINESSWIAARIETETRNVLDRPIFAHTSPVYVHLDRKPRFDPDVARELVNEMRESITTIESEAAFTNDTERNAVLSNYKEAIKTLQSRLRIEE